MQFTAKLNRVYSRVNQLDKKVLLSSIIDDESIEFRDHTWVPFEVFEQFIPKTNLYANLVTFEAEVKNYSYDHSKQQLVGIKNINLMGKVTSTKVRKKAKTKVSKY